MSLGASSSISWTSFVAGFWFWGKIVLSRSLLSEAPAFSWLLNPGLFELFNKTSLLWAVTPSYTDAVSGDSATVSSHSFLGESLTEHSGPVCFDASLIVFLTSPLNLSSDCFLGSPNCLLKVLVWPLDYWKALYSLYKLCSASPVFDCASVKSLAFFEAVIALFYVFFALPLCFDGWLLLEFEVREFAFSLWC